MIRSPARHCPNHRSLSERREHLHPVPSVTFARPISAIGLDYLYPGGTCTVEGDEELIDGLSFPTYRRIATSILLPAHAARPGWAEVAQIDPLELDDATKEVPADDERGVNAHRVHYDPPARPGDLGPHGRSPR